MSVREEPTKKTSRIRKLKRSASNLGKSTQKLGKTGLKVVGKGLNTARNKINAARLSRLRARDAENEEKIRKIDAKHQNGYTAVENIIDMPEADIEQLTAKQLKKIVDNMNVLCQRKFIRILKKLIQLKKTDQSLDKKIAKLQNNQLKF